MVPLTLYSRKKSAEYGYFEPNLNLTSLLLKEGYHEEIHRLGDNTFGYIFSVS